MLLPLLSFYQNLKNREFSQASQSQIDQLRFWFFASMLDNRYGGARHGSTNVVLKKDCETLAELAQGKNPSKEYWNNFRIEYSFEELVKIDGNSNVKFLAINYLMWNKKEFRNFENSAVVSIKNNIEVHHFFPSNYLKSFGKDSQEFDLADSILNKVRINKISNIKINDKSPSTYLQEIENNSTVDLKETLATHYIPDIENVKNGNYDRDYIKFLTERYKAILPLLEEVKKASNNLNDEIYTDIWK